MRDGDPSALAGLCERRGAAVHAYCRQVVGEAGAAAAAAESFASFRVGVVQTPDLTALNPEAMLVSATRHAAARHASRDLPGMCAVVPLLLAGRADRTISPTEGELLEQHLASCWTCRAPVARFKAAERAYRDPRDATIPPEIAAAIVAALKAAAPVRGEQPPEPAPTPVGQPGAQDVPPTRAGVGAAPSTLDVSTVEFRTIDDDDLPSDRELSDNGDGRSPRDARDARGTRRGRGRRGERRGQAGVPATGRGPLGSRRGRAAKAPRAHAARGAVAARTTSGAHLPRPARERSAARAGATRARVALRATAVLPVALVFLALLASLFVAGVFGGDDPASLPQRGAPQDGPSASGGKPDVVVVPGAQQARAAAVEAEKKRARDRLRGQAQPERQPSAAAAAPSAGAPVGGASAPDRSPAPTAPQPRSNPGATATAPSPGRSGSSGGGGSGGAGSNGGAGQIDADNGATGAEELAPTPDSTTVPDLAPPSDPAPPPG